jgi:purine-nucleoside phosphorylase
MFGHTGTYQVNQLVLALVNGRHRCHQAATEFAKFYGVKSVIRIVVRCR